MYQSATPYPALSSMSVVTDIQDQLLEVTVVGCNKLKDTEWISRQDRYVCLEYGSTKFQTGTCRGSLSPSLYAGKSPTFHEKFTFTPIEGMRELNVVVWNINHITYDDFIGSVKVQLQRALSQGYDDSAWPLQTKTGRCAGELRLILHFSEANKPAISYAPSAPLYVVPSAPQFPLYSKPPPASAASYLQPANAYSASSLYASYPPNLAAYPPAPYPPPQPSAYPPPYPAPSAYPPPPYPPPPQAMPHYPQVLYPEIYPSPPY